MPESNASSFIKPLWTRPTLLCRSSQNSDGHHLVVQQVLGFRVQTHTSFLALFTLYRSGTWISQLKLNSLCLQNETLLAAEHNIYMSMWSRSLIYADYVCDRKLIPFHSETSLESSSVHAYMLPIMSRLKQQTVSSLVIACSLHGIAAIFILSFKKMSWTNHLPMQFRNCSLPCTRFCS